MIRRLFDVLAMLLIGDGLLSVLHPRRHCLLWEIGPECCRDIVEEFAEHPHATRVAGLLETILGIMIAWRQED